MCLIDNDQGHVSESLVSVLTTTFAGERGLTGDNDLRWEPIALVAGVVGHLNAWVQVADLADLIHRLPDQGAQVTHDQRPALDA
jgi:hypothetical protein